MKNLKVEIYPQADLVYQSTPQAVEFEHNDWGNFTVVGFMADKYFAGYPDGAVDGAVDDVSLLSDNILSKVLTDTDDKESMSSGSALALEDGYSLSIMEVDVNGETVWVQLEKDGDVVDEAFVSSGQDYIYETDLGEAENIPLIIVHFGTVFAGSETSAVFVQGIFQISDDYTEINNGDTFGEMEISSVSESGITMKNDDDIGLGEDETVEIMGNVSFKTADDSTLRFYPFVEVEGGGNASQELKISVPDEIYAGDTFNVKCVSSIDLIRYTYFQCIAGITSAFKSARRGRPSTVISGLETTPMISVVSPLSSPMSSLFFIVMPLSETLLTSILPKVSPLLISV